MPDRVSPAEPPRSRWGRTRLFTAGDDEPRARRAGDWMLLGALVVAMAWLSLAAVPSSGAEASIIRVIDALPTGLDGLWHLLPRLLNLAAAAVVVAAAAGRRARLLRDQALAAVVAVALDLLVVWAVAGTPSFVWDAVQATAVVWAPWVQLSLPIAIVAVTIPHMTRVARRVGRWAVVLGAGGVMLQAVATPTATAAALVVGLLGAVGAHLVFGSTEGLPAVDDVRQALEAMGVDVSALTPSPRRAAGVALFEAVHVDGRGLDVKVYGGDALDAQFANAVWRTLWYRDADGWSSPSRVQQVTDEALFTLLAAQAGVVTQPVVQVGRTANDDAVLVLERIGRPVLDPAVGEGDAATSPPEPAWPSSPERDLPRLWEVVSLLADQGIVHRQVDLAHLVAVDGELTLRDWRSAGIATRAPEVATDPVQALVLCALATDVDTAVGMAIEALGPERTADLLPYIQPDTCSRAQRADCRDAGLDIDDLRDAVATALAVQPPELARLRRVTWASVIAVVLPVAAFAALMSVFTQLDIDALVESLQGASWWFVGVAAVIAQLTTLTQAVSMMGASPLPLPLSRVLVLQLAQSYVALAVPSAAGRVATNVRFLQRHGLDAVPALTVGALDSVFGFVSQVIVLLGIMLVGDVTLDLDLDAPSGGLWTVLLVMVGLVVVVVVAVVVVPRLRRLVIDWIRTMWSQAGAALAGLASPRRVGLLLAGNLGSQVVAATTLGAVMVALGHPVGMSSLLLIWVAVSLLAGVMPIPGGVGVVEGGLTYGLVVVGVPEETAFAGALLFRAFTFYLPPLWGFFAFRWLERHKYL